MMGQAYFRANEADLIEVADMGWGALKSDKKGDSLFLLLLLLFIKGQG